MDARKKLSILCIILLVIIVSFIGYLASRGEERQVKDAKPDNSRIATDDTLGEGNTLSNETNAGLIVGGTSLVTAVSSDQDEEFQEDLPQEPNLSETDRLYQEMELVRLRQTLEADIAEDKETRALRKQAKAVKITPSRFSFDDINQPIQNKTSAPGGLTTDTSALAGLSPSLVLPSSNKPEPTLGHNASFKTGANNDQDNAVGYSKYKRSPARSPYEIKKGTVIPGSLVTEVTSGIPGDVTAIVRLDVYDTVSGDHLLIPSGSEIFGKYDPNVTYDQDRLPVLWSHLIFPNGDTLVLEDQQGTDIAGRAGFKDKRKGRFLRTLAGNLLYSVLSLTESAAQAKIREELNPSSNNTNSSIGNAIAGLGSQVSGGNTTAASVFNEQQSKLSATFRIRSGYRFNILTSKDFILEPS